MERVEAHLHQVGGHQAEQGGAVGGSGWRVVRRQEGVGGRREGVWRREGAWGRMEEGEVRSSHKLESGQ